MTRVESVHEEGGDVSEKDEAVSKERGKEGVGSVSEEGGGRVSLRGVHEESEETSVWRGGLGK